MTRKALSGNRIFAVAHSLDDTTVAPIAGLGVIRACVVNEDGTSNLILQGISRVEFSKIKMTPFPHGTIRILEEQSLQTELGNLRSEITEVCKVLFREGIHAPHGFSSLLRGAISDSSFADLIGSTVVQDPINRRRIFETLDIEARMLLILEILSARAKSA